MNLNKKNWASAIALATLVSIGCGGPLKYTVQGTQSAVGADAKIVANADKKQNTTQLELKASNLAPPGRVKDGANTYVVWTRRDSSAQWARAGTLNYDEGDRTASFMSVTIPEASFDLQITAEDNQNSASPSNTVVFEQKVGRK